MMNKVNNTRKEEINNTNKVKFDHDKFQKDADELLEALFGDIMRKTAFVDERH